MVENETNLIKHRATLLLGLLLLIFASYAIVLEIEENLIFEAIMNIFLGILFFAGAFGFLKLSKFAVESSANKSAQSDA